MLKNLFIDTRLSPSEIIDKYNSNPDITSYLNRLYKKVSLDKQQLKNLYKGNDIEFIKSQLFSYALHVISLLSKQFENYLTEESLRLLDNLKEQEIELVDDEFELRVTDKILINVNKLDGEDIVSKTVYAKGILIHELFASVMNVVKDKKSIEIVLNDGKKLEAEVEPGFMIQIGMCEKYAIEFCIKNNLFYIISLPDVCYVQLCSYLIKQYPELKTKVFTSDIDYVLSLLEKEDKELYLLEECISYVVRKNDISADNISNIGTEKVEVEEVVEVEVSEFDQEVINLAGGNVSLKELILECHKKNIEFITCQCGNAAKNIKPSFKFAYTTLNMLYICNLLKVLGETGYEFKYSKDALNSYFSIEEKENYNFKLPTQMFENIRRVIRQTYKNQMPKLPYDLETFVALSYEVENDDCLEIKNASTYFQLGYCKYPNERKYYISTHDSYYTTVAIKSGFQVLDDFFSMTSLSVVDKEDAFKPLGELIKEIQSYTSVEEVSKAI